MGSGEAANKEPPQRAQQPPEGCSLGNSFTLTPASSLPLREKKKTQTCPGIQFRRASPRSALLTCLLLSLPPSVLGSPARHKPRAEGAIAGAPLLHTWARDTEHAPASSPASFQGGEGEKNKRKKKTSFPESRLETSQQWMSFILDPFQSISTQKGIKQRANCTQPVLATDSKSTHTSKKAFGGKRRRSGSHFRCRRNTPARLYVP